MYAERQQNETYVECKQLGCLLILLVGEEEVEEWSVSFHTTDDS